MKLPVTEEADADEHSLGESDRVDAGDQREWGEVEDGVGLGVVACGEAVTRCGWESSGSAAASEKGVRVVPGEWEVLVGGVFAA